MGSASLTLDEVKLITDLLPDAHVLLSDSGSILAANPAAHEFLQADSLVGRAFADLVADPAPKVRDWLNHWAASRSMIAALFDLPKDGTGVQVRCEGGLLRTGDTSNPSLVLVRIRKNEAPAADLVEQLNNEIELLKKLLVQQKAQNSQQIAALRTAAAVFAHEIANPLNAVSTCMQILQPEIEQLKNSTIQDMVESASAEIDD